MAKTSPLTFFMIGLWVALFTILANIIIALAIGVPITILNSVEFRGKIVISALVIVLLLVLGIIANGWTAKQAVDKVMK